MYMKKKNWTVFNPLIAMSDQNRISPNSINTISSWQVVRIKKKIFLGDYQLIQYQILQVNIMQTLWQTIRRLIHDILGVKRLNFPTITKGRAHKYAWSLFFWNNLSLQIKGVNPLNLTKDQHVISPHSNTAKSFTNPLMPRSNL